MAHMIESAMFHKTPAWHGLGTVVDYAQSTEEAIVNAGMNWNVRLERLWCAGLDGSFREAPGFATVRDSDDSILGCVGERYEVLQNAAAFDWFDPFVSSGECRFESAGSLDEGRRIWILAELNKAASCIAKDDAIRKFLLLSHAHDGSLAVRVGFTPIRVVCANTLAMAHADRRSNLLRVKHTRGMRPALDVIRDTINLANERFEATAEQYRWLTTRKVVNKADVIKYVRKVLELPEDKKDDKEEKTRGQKASATRSNNTIAEILALYEGQGAGSNLASAEGTWWGAYNAVAEWLSYTRGRSDDSRLSSLWYGDSHNVLASALDTALNMAS